MWVTYATAVTAIDLSLHLGGRRSLHNTYKQICLRAHGGGEGLAWVRSCWVSSNAIAYGPWLRTLARWVRVLALGTVARRESSGMASGELRRSSDSDSASRSAYKTVTGYSRNQPFRPKFHKATIGFRETYML